MKHKLHVLLMICGVLLTLSSISAAQGCDEPDSVKSVTKSSSGNFEYVTFAMVAKEPKYTVRTSRPPFEAGESGEKLPVKGRYFKTIQFLGVHWMCTISDRLAARTSNIMDVKNSYQFEGDVTYVIGYRTRSKYVGHYVTGTGISRKVVVKFKK